MTFQLDSSRAFSAAVMSGVAENYQKKSICILPASSDLRVGRTDVTKH